MDPQTNDSTRYEVQYTDEAKGFLYRRRAATHAAFLVPYLQSGMCLLDCGCGPGSITADLANLVAPGEVIGIDVDATQLELARAHADAAGVSNIRFEKGDVRQLHFDDESFDAVFTHGVIEYVSDPVATFAEIHRVLKPGGVLGSRHGDWGGFLFAPNTPNTTRFFELFQHFVRASGGEPKFGRHQLAALHAAGFERVKPSASYDCWTSDPESTRSTANFLATYSVSPEFVEPIIRLQLATESELQVISDELRLWGETPAAFAAEAWGEAVAWRI